METVSVTVTTGTRERIQRIKRIRYQNGGIRLADQDIVVAAIALYWAICEDRAGMNGMKRIVPESRDIVHGAHEDEMLRKLHGRT